MRALRALVPRRPLGRQLLGMRFYSDVPKPSSPIANPFEQRLQGLVKEYEKFNNIGSQVSADEARDAEGVQFKDERHLAPDLSRLRVVPRERAFFMGMPAHEEIMRTLNDLTMKNQTIPRLGRSEIEVPTWLSLNEYRDMLGAKHFKQKYYRELLTSLNDLALMDPQLVPSSVPDALSRFVSLRSDGFIAKKPKTLDEVGRAIAVGRRKTASARVQLVKGSGLALVNGKPLDEAFERPADRDAMLYPLKVVAGEQSYNIFATVTGGGKTGQASAIAHGIAQALVIHNPLLLSRLARAKCLKRDPRVKERKKPGKVKARKSYTWVKR